MSFFVLDSSVALSWCLPMEAEEDTLKVYELAELRGAIIPALWHLEVANILGIKLRNGVINQATVQNSIDLLACLPIETDQARVPMQNILPLMATYGLTAYDAAYLELALRLQLPLATLDRRLSAARAAAGLPLLPELLS